MQRLAISLGGVALAALLMAGSAAAQDLASGGQAGRPAAAQSGPLLLQPVSSGMVFTPEVKFSTVNHSNATLVGGSGGWLYDDTLFLGGAAYWLTNGKDHTDMWYGGMVVGWTVPVGSMLRIGGKGLVGFGDATVPYEMTVPAYPHPYHSSGGSTGTVTQWYWASTGFFVFEPQATAILRLTKKVSFDFSGGYRVIGDANGLDHELRGGFGSIGVRFGPF
jgi:hypothetical protein